MNYILTSGHLTLNITEDPDGSSKLLALAHAKLLLAAPPVHFRILLRVAFRVLFRVLLNLLLALLEAPLECLLLEAFLEAILWLNSRCMLTGFERFPPTRGRPAGRAYGSRRH